MTGTQVNKQTCIPVHFVYLFILLEQLWSHEFRQFLQRVYQARARAADEVIVERQDLSIFDRAQVFPSGALGDRFR